MSCDGVIIDRIKIENNLLHISSNLTQYCEIYIGFSFIRHNGTEKQSEELVKFLLDEFEIDTQRIWQTDIFGKSLHDLVKEGLSNKLSDMPEDVRYKLQETLQRIINEGTEGVMCIIL